MSIRRGLAAIASCVLMSAPALSGEPSAEDPYAAGREIVAEIQKIVTPTGVQESFIATLGGVRQFVSVRGADRANPILLFLHGGPGAVEMPIAWAFQRPWEDFFTVVQWDQRGAGKTFPLTDPAVIAPTLSLERYRDDAIELIELLRRRYAQKKVFVLGHSWGSAIGLAVAAHRPELLHAYIGMGQIIDLRAGERAGIAWTLERARERGDDEAIREIEALRPYPDAGPFTIERADGWRKWSVRYGALAAHREDADFYLRAPRLSPEYTPEDRRAWGEGSAFTVRTLWPRLADLSFRNLRKLRVPVVLLNGRHDYTTPVPLAEEWMAQLEAPSKVTVWFEHSAHLPMIEEPGRVLEALVRHARPLAAGASRGSGALDEPHDEDQQDRADRRDDDGAEQAATRGQPHDAEQPAAEHGADDADHDVADHAETAAFHDHARQPSRDETDDDEPEKFHGRLP
jgi:proline iminopeptidase